MVKKFKVHQHCDKTKPKTDYTYLSQQLITRSNLTGFVDAHKFGRLLRW